LFWKEGTKLNFGCSSGKIIYANNKFVFVGNNTSAYSEDGINWTAAVMPQGTNYSTVAYGNDKFIAISAIDNTVA
jgi:hypothetical protein